MLGAGQFNQQITIGALNAKAKVEPGKPDNATVPWEAKAPSPLFRIHRRYDLVTGTVVWNSYRYHFGSVDNKTANETRLRTIQDQNDHADSFLVRFWDQLSTFQYSTVTDTNVQRSAGQVDRVASPAVPVRGFLREHETELHVKFSLTDERLIMAPRSELPEGYGVGDQVQLDGRTHVVSKVVNQPLVGLFLRQL